MAAADLTSFYESPDLLEAQKAAQQTGKNLVEYQSAASLLPEKLRAAIQEKLDYNKDLIGETNKAFGEYATAPSEARAKYADPTSESYIFNPFQAEQLVEQEKAGAYTKFANLSDILSERRGNISEMVKAGTAAFNSAVLAAQGKAELAKGNFDEALKLAQLKADAQYKEEAQKIDKARLANETKKVNSDIADKGTVDATTQSYVDLVQNGRITFANVPADYKDAVSVALATKPFSSADKAAYDSILNGIQKLRDLNKPEKFLGVIPLTKQKAEIDTWVKTTGMQIARLYEKGRLSDQDREFYLSLLPTSVTPIATALTQLDQIESAIKAHFEGLTGTSGGTDTTPKTLNDLDPLGIRGI